MIKAPVICANLRKIKENAACILGACRQQGVTLAAVTKVVCAHEPIVNALIESGVPMLADARTKNLARLPEGLPRLALRLTDPELADETAEHAQYSLESGIDAIRALGRAAEKRKKRHGVILMIDLGDLREGIFYQDGDRILDTAALALSQEGLSLAGLGANLTCYGGILPDEHNMGILLGWARRIRERFHIPLPLVSGGNSSSLHLLLNGRLPRGINHLRVGEGLLLGMDTSVGKPMAQLSQRAFTQYARLVEVYHKPSRPEGKTGPNAFGESVSFEDRGPMARGILAIGRQDTDQGALTPRDERVRVLGGSSDHLLVDLTQAPGYQVGDVLGFYPGYSAMLRAYTSAYVAKSCIDTEGNLIHE